MKILKRIGLVILALIALLLIVAAFLPKEFDTSRSIIINRSRAEVFEYIRHVKNQDNYGKWQLMDPGLKRNYQGTDGTVGFRYDWESDKLGNGYQKITEIVEGEKMNTELGFGFGEPATAYFETTDAGPGRTKVVWGLRGRSPYPTNIMSLFFDVGNDFQEGLENLKQVMER